MTCVSFWRPSRTCAPLALAALLLARPALASDVMADIHADRWDAATAATAADPDPVAAKLVTFYRMLAPGQANATEIDRFRADSPDWPFQASLVRRRDEALAKEPDDATAAALCAADHVTSAAALQRCAAAAAALGHSGDAEARAAWIAMPADPADESAFLARWGGTLGRAEQWARFAALAWSNGAPGTARQATRLDPADQPRAKAWLALLHDDPQAIALVEALPDAERTAPGMMLAEARYLRRAALDAEALKLWLASGTAAEKAAPAAHRAAFWEERNILARHRLRDGDAAGAYALAAGHAQTGAEQIADAEFLAGFVALRRLDDRAKAAPHFARLAEVSKAVITQARAHFWLGRAAADETAARREYALAAAYPSTFYGQLAVLALGEGPAGLARRIQQMHDPVWDPGQALAFAGRELARASAYLVGWGERGRAQAFLLRLSDIVPDPVDRSIAARLASGFGMPETAIAIARRAGREGTVLLDAGWPQAASLPPDTGVEPALALGIVRQESSFDPTTISPAGAQGLMQLLPGTAELVARQIGYRMPLPSLTANTGANIRLGTAYLRGLMQKFDNCTPLAVAAYNAGPSRVQQWLLENGNPRQGGVEMLDWIELIPFGETRNYVQRVIENEEVYRARSGEILPHPLAQWLR
ncbi:MAG TPA: lytic transglycosylase domain-containing protein [Acetobacteraceae bacterium]|nr:lytic transglycosylase domain-containing protein [Acetobacteraceae bacterium]